MKSNVIPLIPNTAETISLTSSAGISEVETLMNALAQGARFEFAGQMVKEHLSTGGKRIRARLALSSAAPLRFRGMSVPGPLRWSCSTMRPSSTMTSKMEIRSAVVSQPPGFDTVRLRPSMQAIASMFLALSQTSDSVRWHCHDWPTAASIVRGQVEEMTCLKRKTLLNLHTSGQWKDERPLSLPVEGSALLSGHSSESARRIGEAFTGLGTLFQLQDDVLDLYGQKGRQMAGMDICEGKVSALVVRHVEAKPEQRDLLLSILRLPREETTEAHIAQMSQAFKDSGALDSS